MTKIRQISTIGSSILRERSSNISDIPDPQIDVLINDLIATARDANGVGIAAPQVASSLRLFIVASRPSLRYPSAPTMEPTAMINPQIIDRSGDLVSGWEGCLSVPGMRGLVLRDRQIEVEYLTKHGDRVRQELTGFVARIFQHELDHLDGILFPDRVISPANLITESEYIKIVFES